MAPVETSIRIIVHICVNELMGVALHMPVDSTHGIEKWAWLTKDAGLRQHALLHFESSYY